MCACMCFMNDAKTAYVRFPHIKLEHSSTCSLLLTTEISFGQSTRPTLFPRVIYSLCIRCVCVHLFRSKLKPHLKRMSRSKFHPSAPAVRQNETVCISLQKYCGKYYLHTLNTIVPIILSTWFCLVNI